MPAPLPPNRPVTTHLSSAILVLALNDFVVLTTSPASAVKTDPAQAVFDLLDGIVASFVYDSDNQPRREAFDSPTYLDAKPGNFEVEATFDAACRHAVRLRDLLCRAAHAVPRIASLLSDDSADMSARVRGPTKSILAELSSLIRRLHTLLAHIEGGGGGNDVLPFSLVGSPVAHEVPADLVYGLMEVVSDFNNVSADPRIAGRSFNFISATDLEDDTKAMYHALYTKVAANEISLDRLPLCGLKEDRIAADIPDEQRGAWESADGHTKACVARFVDSQFDRKIECTMRSLATYIARLPPL